MKELKGRIGYVAKDVVDLNVDMKDYYTKEEVDKKTKLPVASAGTLGGVKVGAGLAINNGVLSATGGGTADAVEWNNVLNKPTLSDVATSGSYKDLNDKPTIPDIDGYATEEWVETRGYLTEHQDIKGKVNKTDLANVAFSGNYSDLKGKPEIPEGADLTGYATENWVESQGYLTEHQSLANYATKAEVQAVENKIPDVQDFVDQADLATVAKTGSYNDLKDKPTIPEGADLTGYAKESWVEGKGYTTMAEVEAKGYLTEHQSLANYALKSELPTFKTDLHGNVYKINSKDISALYDGNGDSISSTYAKTANLSTVATSGSYEDLTNKPNLFSGNYQDLTNKPTIPDAYTLPVASTDTLGGVKVDGSTITIADGVISSAGGSGSGVEAGTDTVVEDGKLSTIYGGSYTRATKDYAMTIKSNTTTTVTIENTMKNVSNSSDYIYSAESYVGTTEQKLYIPYLRQEALLTFTGNINGTVYTFPQIKSYYYTNGHGANKFIWEQDSITVTWSLSDTKLTFTGISITSASDFHVIVKPKVYTGIMDNYIPNSGGVPTNQTTSNYGDITLLPTQNYFWWERDKGLLVSGYNRLMKDSATNTIVLGYNNGIGRTGDNPTMKNSIILGDNNALQVYGANCSEVICCGSNSNWQNFGYIYDSLLIGTNRGFSSEAKNSVGYMVLAGEENYSNPSNNNKHIYGFGQYLTVKGNNFVIGKGNINDVNEEYAFIIGNGTSRVTGNQANALTVDRTGNLAIAGTMSSAGADYAEFFEWKDGNPEAQDRVGYIVTLDGDKLTLANEGDYILGVVSGTATVLGDNPEWNWAKRWVTDDFGRVKYEWQTVTHEAFLDDEGNVITPEKTESVYAPVPNPDYNPDQEYTKRADRPEWSAVGMMGKLYVRDDGTCQVNGFAKPINGVATASTSGTMRVIERVSDNVIRVVIK